jgi:hypothetical protein
MAKKGDKHGIKNLKPFNTLTEKEQRKMASNGGKKSGEVRKKKKDLKERLKLGLEIFTEMKANKLKELGNDEGAKIVKEIGIETYTLLDIVSDEKNNSQVKLSAINDILDRTEGKPIQKSILDANITEKELSEKEQELIDRHLKKEAK